VGPERRFEYQGKKYILFVTSDSLGKDAKPQIKLAEETPQSIKLLKVNGVTPSERVVAPAVIDPSNGNILKPEISKSSWIAYIHSFNNTSNFADPVSTGQPPNPSITYQNADVTGRSYRKAEDDLAALVVSVAKPEMHGHHIIFKKGLGRTQRELAQEAKDMVLRFGVNPFWDAACLAYAPNWGHNAVVLGEIKKRIEGKYNSWLGDLSTAQAEIKKLMAQIALDWCKRSPTLGFKP
jgi:hypothetical protein